MRERVNSWSESFMIRGKGIEKSAVKKQEKKGVGVDPAI